MSKPGDQLGLPDGRVAACRQVLSILGLHPRAKRGRHRHSHGRSLHPHQKRIKSRASPSEELGRAEHQEDQQAPVSEAGVWLVAPAVGRPLKRSHGVVPQIAIRTRPNSTMTVLMAAEKMNKKSAAWRMRLTLVCALGPVPVLQVPGGAASCLKPAHHAPNCFPIRKIALFHQWGRVHQFPKPSL